MTRDLPVGSRDVAVGCQPETVLFRLGIDGRIVFWSEQARQMLGYSPVEMVGRSYGRLFPESEAADLAPARELGDAESIGRVPCFGLRIRRDGQPVPAIGTISVERDLAGEIVGFCVAIAGDRHL